MHYMTKTYLFTIVPSEVQPHARGDITYKFFIRDRDTREPIQNGEGQIYANNKEGARTWEGDWLPFPPRLAAPAREAGVDAGRARRTTVGDAVSVAAA